MKNAPPPTSLSATIASLAALLAAVGLLGGCLSRALLIKTPGYKARIYLDGAYMGETSGEADSLAIPFDHYGTHKIAIKAEGCLPREESLTLEVPWFSVFPLDLFTEVLIPYTFEDIQERRYLLVKAPKEDSREALFRRADSLRVRLRQAARAPMEP